MIIFRYAIAASIIWTLTSATAIAQEAQEQCKVLDPELQLSFEGDCVNGAAFGSGIARGKDGAWYEGQFLAGAKTGQGTKHYSTGDVYTGQWKRDKRHGYGTYVFGEGSPWRGDRYEGYWQNDLRHGSGTYIFFPSGDRFQAQWENGGTDSLGTTTLARRQQAYKAMSISLGEQVCTTATDGASPRRIASGEVTQILEDRALIKIKNQEVIEHSKSKRNPRWEIITNWVKCKK